MIYQEHKEAIAKLRSLVDDIKVCLFCTKIKTDDGSTCRPMSAVKVCEEGNIWFFSEKNSEKNSDIAKDKDVQLFFSHPSLSSYMVVNGEAEIILDRFIIEDLWSPDTAIWFKEGKDDPTVSLIKVTPKNGYYWDTDDGQMINFLRRVASVVAGKNLVKSNEGPLKLKA